MVRLKDQIDAIRVHIWSRKMILLENGNNVENVCIHDATLYAGTQLKEDLTAELIVFNRKDKAKNYFNICLIITEITGSNNKIEYLSVMFLIF